MIRLELKDYTCTDGCCYEQYYDVYFNDELVGHTDYDTTDSVVEFINEFIITK
jgi:hypothetical protein